MNSATRPYRSTVATVPARVHRVNSSLLVLLAISFLLAIHAAFRGTGADFDAAAYALWLDRIAKLSPSEFLQDLLNSNIYYSSDLFFSFEVGFAIFSFLFSRFSSNLELYFFLIALISLSLKSVAISRFCRHPGWAFLWYASWYYLLQEMTTMRAGIAAGLVLLGYGALREERYWKFAALVCCACTFHISAAAALLLIPLRKINPSPRTVLLLLVGAFAFSYASILPLISFLADFSDKLSEYYRLYTEVGLYENVNRFNVVILLRIAILLWVNWTVWKSATRGDLFDFEYSLFAISVFFYYLSASFPLLGGRIYELLGIFQVFLISSIVGRHSLRLRIGPLIALTCVLQFYILVFHVRFVDFFYFVGTPYQIETTHKSN